MTAGPTVVRLRFFDPDGTELDDVIIWQSGNIAGIGGRATMVEVTLLDAESALAMRDDARNDR